jgi:hypothetical protein
MNSLMKMDGMDTASSFNELLCVIKEKAKGNKVDFMDDSFCIAMLMNDRLYIKNSL